MVMTMDEKKQKRIAELTAAVERDRKEVERLADTIRLNQEKKRLAEQRIRTGLQTVKDLKDQMIGAALEEAVGGIDEEKLRLIGQYIKDHSKGTAGKDGG